MNEKTTRDIRILSDFVAIYCREIHKKDNKKPFKWGNSDSSYALVDKEIALCHDCTRLLQYGIIKRLACPHNPKPMCKNCKTQCYAPGYREEIRKVMRFSGLYLIKRGRLDLLFHYLL